MIVDNDLIFDEKRKRYYLTEDYIYNELGVDLASILVDDLDPNVSTLTKRKIKYACDMLYGFIDDNAFNKTATYYAFTVDEDMHNALKEALGYQLYFFALNGDVSNDIDFDVKSAVSKRAIQVLNGVGAFNVVANIPKGW